MIEPDDTTSCRHLSITIFRHSISILESTAFGQNEILEISTVEVKLTPMFTETINLIDEGRDIKRLEIPSQSFNLDR
jgi:hypothetical protein